MCVDGDRLGWRLPDLAEHLDSVVALVGHVDVPSTVNRNPTGFVKLAAAAAYGAPLAYEPTVAIENLHPCTPLVGHEDVPGPVDSYSTWTNQLAIPTGYGVPLTKKPPVAIEGLHPCIGHIDVPGPVNRYSFWINQLVIAPTPGAVTPENAAAPVLVSPLAQELAARVKHLYPVVTCIAHVDVPCPVNRNTTWMGQASGFQLAEEIAARVKNLYPAAACVCHVDVSGPVNRNSTWMKPGAPLTKKPPVFIKHLRPVVSGVGHVDVTSTVNRDSTWAGELAVAAALGSPLE